MAPPKPLKPGQVDVDSQSAAWGDWPGESAKAREAFDDYYSQEPPRTVEELVKYYRDRKADGLPVPASTNKTIYGWSKEFRWKERAEQRDQERRRGYVKPDGRMTKDGLKHEREERDEETDEAEKRWAADIYKQRIEDPKTTASAIPGLMRGYFEALGINLKEDSHLNPLTGLPPGIDALNLSEAELMYRRITEAQNETLAEIMRLRAERANPQPLQLHNEKPPPPAPPPQAVIPEGPDPYRAVRDAYRKQREATDG